MWSALSNMSYIGPPKLIGLLKNKLNEYLRQKNLNNEVVTRFVRILVLISIFNQENEQKYPISNIEIRQILRIVGSKFLNSVALELGKSLRKAKETERSDKWQKIIKPVFTEIWPLDQDMKTSTTNESWLR